MDKHPHSPAREIIVANAIRAVANELRLVDVADYIAFIRLESLASVADIVESAAELYFMPGTLRLGHGCDARVSWSGSPQISLDLELRPGGVTVYFTLELSDDNAAVEVNYVAFDDPAEDPEVNSRYLADALQASRIVRSERPLING